MNNLLRIFPSGIGRESTTNMPIEVPSDVLKAVREGRAVLLLGAGASRGAIDSDGRKIPLAKELGADIAKRFLDEGYAELDFRIIYDLACSQSSVREVQKFVHDRLEPFYPTDFHKLIPTFSWGGLLTTNYDLIVERAYEQVGSDACQNVLSHVKDSDGAPSRQDARSLLYVKLHGCITEYQNVKPPMIASTEQLIAFRDGRVGQFDTFLEWSRNKTIIFVGYSFSDSNLRQLLDEIIKEGDNRLKHYIVDPTVLPYMSDYWRERRLVTIKCSFEELLRHLSDAIAPSTRALGSLNAAIEGATSFTKFISVSTQRESDQLKMYLEFGIDHVFQGKDVPKDDPKRFFKGFDLGWFPIAHELDVRRTVSDNILSDCIIIDKPTQALEFVVLKGHAGAGKSVSLRRTCWDAATSYDRLCFFANREVILSTQMFEEIFSLTNLRIYLFIDGCSLHKNKIVEIMAVARQKKAALTIVGAETFNLWNVSCESLERYVTAEYEMNNLSEREIIELIRILEDNQSLGNLAKIPPEKRVSEFTQSFERQILVALLEATHGLPLIDIIQNEYKSVEPGAARVLYLDICTLHRFGPPVRAGLISRIHNITFDQFEAELFKPLEQIVKLRMDKKSGDFVYEARHPQIADALYETVVQSQEERFEGLVRIISKLNPSFSYDIEVLSRLIRADGVLNTISDPVKARQIYESAAESVGDLAVVKHQRGIYEMRLGSSIGELRKAAEYLEQASEKEQWNKSIKHSLAELDLKRSRVATEPLEKRAWRREATARASELMLGDTSAFPYHTMLKAEIDEVAEALEIVEGGSDSENAVRILGENIAKAEDTLKRGTTKFPSDQLLLSAEGDLAKVLSNSPRAENAFLKAFLVNPRSTLVAKRLTRILKAKGDVQGASDIIKKALVANPANQDLHYDLAMTLMEISPDADRVAAEEINYHLRRSFSIGDRNHNQQFWYARNLSISGSYEEAKPIFERLEALDISYSKKSYVHGFVKSADGNDLICNGVIETFRGSFAFAKCEQFGISVYIPSHELLRENRPVMYEGTLIVFRLGFNYRGPVASSVRVRTKVGEQA